MKFKLDFNLETSSERLELVKTFDLSSLTKKELELCTDYILYGKESDGFSAVDKKQIYIKAKHSTYQKKEPLSLEELLESPSFDESILDKNRTIYKKPKVSIDRNNEQIQAIPGIKDLWVQIDNIQHLIELCKGKTEPLPNEKIPNFTSKDLYLWEHHLVELRKDQYLLKEFAIPTILSQKNYGSFWLDPSLSQLNFKIFPAGLIDHENDPNFTHPERGGFAQPEFNIEEQIRALEHHHKPYFNFLDTTHIYFLVLQYYEIKEAAKQLMGSPLNNLLLTLDFYADKANLNEQQKLILEGKKLRLSNLEICELLDKELGIYHQPNYISTIWTRICLLIQQAAELSYDEILAKDYPKAWKTCRVCGRTLLRDPRNFVRKGKAVDGLCSICKRCEAERRKARKAAKQALTTSTDNSTSNAAIRTLGLD